MKRITGLLSPMRPAPPRRWHYLRHGLAALSCVAASSALAPARAQTVTTPLSPAATAFGGVNVLIVTFSHGELTTSLLPPPLAAPVEAPTGAEINRGGGANTANPAAPGANQPAPITPAAPITPGAPITPVAPLAPRAPIAPVVPIRPVPGALIEPRLAPHWMAEAKKRKPTDQAGTDNTAPGPEFNRNPQVVPDTNAPTAIPAPGGANITPVPEPAQMVEPVTIAGIDLRLDLLKAGFQDVLPTSPSDNALVRAVDDHRLSNDVIESLRVSLQQMAEAPGVPDANTVAAAVRAAVRVGQAEGYRAVAVVTIGDEKQTADAANPVAASFSMLLADDLRESGDPIIFDERGKDSMQLWAAGALTGASLIEKSILTWPVLDDAATRQTLARKHLLAAQAASDGGDRTTAQEEIAQSVALDDSNGHALELQGDLLAGTDPAAAALAYQRAAALNAHNGSIWAKIAIASATGSTPDWPRTLDAGRKALAAGYDTAALRTAMATAEFGRADIFRKADKLDRAEDAEYEAHKHLDRALELAPDDPTAVRLLAHQMVQEERYDEAVQTLDRIAPHYPRDVEIQSQYATALSHVEGRDEDAFVTSARLWALTGATSVDLDDESYNRLSSGFDLHIFNIGKTAAQLTTGVANAALPRESALLEFTKLKEELAEASAAIKMMRPSAAAGTTALVSRTFAADLMNQSLDAHQTYLETGQEFYRKRGLELYRQAVGQLNILRAH